MALLFELVSLALKPLVLAKLSCQIGARSIFIIVQTWLEVMRFAVYLHIVILWRLAIGGAAILSLPVRAFTALYRERMLEMQLYRVKNELEIVLWDRKELEEKLHLAVKERKVMETMLTELEDEHDEAIVKIETLEGEVQDLKDEIQRLKEVHGKALSSYMFNSSDRTITDNLDKSSQKPDYSKNTRQMSKDLHKDETHGPMKTESNVIIPRDNNIILAQQREIALSRSLFSATLSLIVGLVVLEAENPCMPLVVALLTVVIMSLTSVVRLFTRIEHKPALDAVALLSLNWFVLGTLAYHMLPRIARFLAPLTLSLAKRTSKWLGL